MALRFHKAGNQVIVAGRRKALLEQITTDHPGIEAIELDVADAKSIVQASELVATRHPDLNVVINNAGIMVRENVLKPESLKVAEETVAINLLGTIRMTHAFLPQLAKKKDSVIINVSSALAFVPFPIAMTYSATKAAVHAFTEALRVQLADTSVRVIGLAPPACAPRCSGRRMTTRPCPWTTSLMRRSPFCIAHPRRRKSSWNALNFSALPRLLAITTPPLECFPDGRLRTEIKAHAAG